MPPAATAPGTSTVLGYFQPTFLYEALWDVAIGFGLLLLDRRLRLGRGNVMALYVMGYTAGRVWIEALRSDHANRILGLRLNDWTSVIVFIGGLVWFLRHGGFHAEREETPYYDTEPDGQPPPAGRRGVRGDRGDRGDRGVRGRRSEADG